MLWLVLGGLTLFLFLGGLRAFERASVTTIKSLLAWIAALGGISAGTAADPDRPRGHRAGRAGHVRPADLATLAGLPRARSGGQQQQRPSGHPASRRPAGRPA